ncbi:DUF6602 domain-containing protein [Candidatus Thiodiazotropha sp. LNASS1]|uniref:DUF6602 domain-containing protein n=1 Tax=Candidatus Thiodiazotropha sp. LNASS1 TaxID=3096260 RepID=UPI0034DE0EEC
MENGTLHTIFSELHNDIRNQLIAARRSIGHPGAKGDASEEVWLELFKEYLPARYQAEKAFVVDSKGKFSDQIDVVIFDQQYSPFLFKFHGQTYIPAESVYAVFEAKQAVNAGYIEYAQEKITSVRRLHRTSLPIPHAGGVYPPKPLIPIIGGILTLESEWNPPLGDSLDRALCKGLGDSLLNMGCIAEHGIFLYESDSAKYMYMSSEKAATAFIFELIARLQFSGTVPMIDIREYAKFLND